MGLDIKECSTPPLWVCIEKFLVYHDIVCLYKTHILFVLSLGVAVCDPKTKNLLRPQETKLLPIFINVPTTLAMFCLRKF